MSYQLTLYQDAFSSLVTTSRVVTPQDVTPLQDSLALLSTVQQWMDNRRQAIDAAERDAQERGYRAGYEAGQAQALEASAHELTRSLQDISVQLAQQRDELRAALVQLASGLVRCMAAELAPEQVVTALAVRAFEQVVPAQVTAFPAGERAFRAVSARSSLACAMPARFVTCRTDLRGGVACGCLVGWTG